LLADSAGWYDYYVNISDKPQITDIVKPDFSALTDVVHEVGTAKEKEDQERMRMFLLFATDNLTMPLTILSALEDIKWEKSHLNVHIVGATGRELIALGNFEEIVHLLPGLRSLHITAAGPGLAGGDLGQQGSPFLPKTPVDCCPACKADGRTRSISIYQGLYHDFAVSPHYDKPDLAVLFNSGWVDGEDAESDWAPTINMLVDGDVPVLFTTYNEQEARNESAKLKDMGAKFAVEAGANKWRGLVPTPEFIDEEYGMWFQNAYRYVIQGKSA
jgi:splicing suppressor protein 51